MYLSPELAGRFNRRLREPFGAGAGSDSEDVNDTSK